MAPPYRRIRWLGFHFGSRDDDHFKQELQTVANVFRQRFGASAEIVQIPRGQQDATSVVASAITNFKQKHPSDNELLIVTYGGHGIVDLPVDVKSPTRSLLWQSSDGAQIVQWNWIQDNCLFPGAKDTLVILDCCYAGAAERSGYIARKDILAACAWNKRTPLLNIQQSFTSFLLRAINGFQQPFTIAELHAAIKRLRPVQEPLYQSLPPNATHDIVLTPTHPGRPAVSRTLLQETSSDIIEAEGIKYIDIVIGFGRWSFKIRIWFGSSANVRAQKLEYDVETESLIEPLTQGDIPAGIGYSQQDDDFFEVGRVFAIPWSDVTQPRQALPVLKPAETADQQEVIFQVIKAGDGFSNAVARSNARHSVQYGKTYTMSTDLLVRDVRGEDTRRRLASSGSNPNTLRPATNGRMREPSATSTVAPGSEAEILNKWLRAGYSRERLIAEIKVRMQRGMTREQALQHIMRLLSVSAPQKGRNDGDEEEEEDSEEEDSDEAEYSS